MLPKKLRKKLEKRAASNSTRKLGSDSLATDFSSNDYLGLSKNETIFKNASETLTQYNLAINGATGSRLLTGNHELYADTELEIAKFHRAEAALIFNSGYDANLGFFSSVPQRGDVILYDELCHASIRDGITMSNAKSYKFSHNDTDPLKELLSVRAQSRTQDSEIYIVTESVFSMDGDSPDLKKIAAISAKHNAHLIIDEAHAVGVLGEKGEGLVQELGLEQMVFARIVTFGKALGCHGAAVLGSNELQQYLINYARSFIYTTGLPPHSVAAIKESYSILENNCNETKSLKSNIAILRNKIERNIPQHFFIKSDSAIHSCIVGDISKTKKISEVLKKEGFDVKPILSPTVPKGQERLRICLHSYNTEVEISNLITSLKRLLSIA